MLCLERPVRSKERFFWSYRVFPLNFTVSLSM